MRSESLKQTKAYSVRGAAATPTLLSFQQFSARHPAFGVGSLRWLRYCQGTNGFAPAFVVVGSRVLVWEEEFFRIVARQDGRDGFEGASRL